MQFQRPGPGQTFDSMEYPKIQSIVECCVKVGKELFKATIVLFLAADPCASNHGCQQVCYRGSGNQEACTCFANYELESDRKKCKGAG